MSELGTTDAALRASKQWFREFEGRPDAFGIPLLAEVIDEATGLPELIAAAEKIADSDPCFHDMDPRACWFCAYIPNGVQQHEDDCAWAQIVAALAKAKGIT